MPAYPGGEWGEVIGEKGWIYNPFMESRIWVDRYIVPSDECEDLPDTYIASYENEIGLPVASGEGPTWQQALETLYQRLDRQGYSRAALPQPVEGNTYVQR